VLRVARGGKVTGARQIWRQTRIFELNGAVRFAAKELRLRLFLSRFATFGAHQSALLPHLEPPVCEQKFAGCKSLKLGEHLV
jgi:hypothetical protein